MYCGNVYHNEFNLSFTLHKYHWTVAVTVKTFKIYSQSNIQVKNTVLLTLPGCTLDPELVHLNNEKRLYRPLTNISSFPQPAVPGTRRPIGSLSARISNIMWVSFLHLAHFTWCDNVWARPCCCGRHLALCSGWVVLHCARVHVLVCSSVGGIYRCFRIWLLWVVLWRTRAQISFLSWFLHACSRGSLG